MWRAGAGMGLALALLAGCAEDSAPPTGPELQPLAVFEQSAAHYGAHARGRDEVPPNASRAQGQLLLRLSEDGTELHYKLIVANITNVTQSHIHLAPAGVNGPIVAWLYPSAPPAQLLPGRSDGILATGTITAASLVGPLGGMPLEALISAIEEGTAYVNVHTQQFPPGEIRGQLP